MVPKGHCWILPYPREIEIYSIWFCLQPLFKCLVKTMLYPEPEQCIFKHTYFAMLSSVVFGRYIYKSQHIFGKKLVTKIHVDCDIMITMKFDLGFNPSVDVGSPSLVLIIQINISKQFKEYMLLGFFTSNGQGFVMHIVDCWHFKTLSTYWPSMTLMDAIEDGYCIIYFSKDSSNNSLHFYGPHKRSLKKGNMIFILGCFAILVMISKLNILINPCTKNNKLSIVEARIESSRIEF